MEYIALGKTDLKVSRICMGCMGFGDSSRGQHSWTLDEEHSREIIRNGLEQGINFFDTAIGYQNGTSEQYLGRALRDMTQRNNVVVATKFLPRTPEEIQKGISGQQHIEHMIDASLRNLGMDYVDLYIYHMWDYRTSMYEILEGLNNQVKKGKIRYIGISNCYAWQLARMNDIAQAEGFAKFVSVQNHYNLIFREEEREMAKLCKFDNIAMTPYSALASGRLSRTSEVLTKRLNEDSYAHLKYDSTAAEDEKIILRVKEIADKYKVSMTQIALSWLIRNVTSPVVGATRLEQVEDMVKAVDVSLNEEDVKYLEELYRPHNLVGVMAQNTGVSSDKNLVWMQNLKR